MSNMWSDFFGQLKQLPSDAFRFLPPVSKERVDVVEQTLGIMPAVLRNLLCECNGAELYIGGIPMVTLFGISIEPLPSALEWAPDWYIDKFTPAWRKMSSRDSDWALAMTNYGGLVVLTQQEQVMEWDINERRWLSDTVSIANWLEQVKIEGEKQLKD